MWIYFLFLPLIIACGKKDEASENSLNSNCGGSSYVQMDSTVPEDQQCLLKADFLHITRLSGLPEDSTSAKTMGVSDFSASSLTKWIQDRVKYVTGESYDPTTTWKVASNANAYPPVAFADFVEPTSATTVMSNIGAAVYLKGKEKSWVIDVPVAGSMVRVFSPRVGIIKVGPGLFGTTNQPKGGGGVESMGARLARIATLFHEARHSDGNGSNAAFIHSTCPSGHEMAGHAACDSKVNGPYEIEAILQKKFYQSCQNCTSEDKQLLLLRYSDDSNRLLSGATWADPSPEKIQ